MANLIPLITQLENAFPLENLEEYYTRFNDEELKKIKKQYKIQKSQDISQLEKGDLLEKVKKVFKNVKQHHVDLLTQTKKLSQVTVEKDKLANENNTAKNQVKKLEDLRQDLGQKYKEQQDKYSEIVEQEKQNKAALIEGFQAEIKLIQERMEEAAKSKHIKLQENELLKNKSKEINEHMEKREKLFETELLKIENSRKDRELKIDEQIEQIAKSMGTAENVDEQLEKLKEEEQLIESHLTPYTGKTEEFYQIIEQTNKSFTLYKDEVEKLTKQHQTLEKNTYNLLKKCEKSDIYLLDMVKEHLKIQQDAQKKRDQLEQLNELLKKLQSQCGN